MGKGDIFSPTRVSSSGRAFSRASSTAGAADAAALRSGGSASATSPGSSPTARRHLRGLGSMPLHGAASPPPPLILPHLLRSAKHPSPRLPRTTGGGATPQSARTPRGLATGASTPRASGSSGGGAIDGSSGSSERAPGQAVFVALHVRPMSAAEERERCQPLLTVAPDKAAVLVSTAARTEGFPFDAVFGADAGGMRSGELYGKCVRPLVEGVFAGINGTCFAYGQTGAGKSYTMVGGLISACLGGRDGEGCLGKGRLGVQLMGLMGG